MRVLIPSYFACTKRHKRICDIRHELLVNGRQQQQQQLNELRVRKIYVIRAECLQNFSPTRCKIREAKVNATITIECITTQHTA